jgi:hypothetical protein
MTPFQFVEEEDGIGSLPYRVGQEAALLVDDVSGGEPMSRATVCFS